VLLVDRVQVGVRPAHDRTVTAVRVIVRGEGLRARVDHDLAGHRVRDDCHLDRERTGVEVAVDPVEQRVRTRAELVDTRLVGEVTRRRRTAGDPVTADARGGERVPGLAEQLVHRHDPLAHRRCVPAAMPRVAADPCDLYRR